MKQPAFWALVVRLSETCQSSISLGGVRLAGGVDLSTEVGCGRARLGEVAGEDGLEEGAEENLSAAEGGGACVRFISSFVGAMQHDRLTQSGEEPSKGRG